MTMDDRYDTMYRSTAMNFNNTSSDNALSEQYSPSMPSAMSQAPSPNPNGLSFQPAHFGGTAPGYGMSLPERRAAAPDTRNAGAFYSGSDNSMPDPQEKEDLYQAGNGLFRAADGRYLDMHGNPRDENGNARLTFPSMGDTPHDGRWANPPGTGLHPNDYPGLDPAFYQNPNIRLNVDGFRQKQRETLMNQQQQAQYQQQLQYRQQLQARQQPQQSQPDTGSNPLTDIAKGTWKALTEGGAAAVEAGGKAWDEREKIKDGAELGFKMAGPVVAHTAEKVGWDVLYNVASVYGRSLKPDELRAVVQIVSSPEVQAARQFFGAEKEAQEIAKRLKEIVRMHHAKE